MFSVRRAVFRESSDSGQRAMIYYGFLVTLAATALAGTPPPTADIATQTEDRPVLASDICFFSIPSIRCMNKCQKLSQEAYCEQQKCLCKADQTEQQPQDKDQEHHETGKASVPTSGPAETTTIAAKPTEEESPMKCFLGFHPRVCEKRCNQRGLQAHCEARMDGEFCVCVPHTEQPQQLNTNTALVRLPSQEDNALMCYMGRKPLKCIMICHQRDQQAHCDNRNVCVCDSERHINDISEGDNVVSDMCPRGVPGIPCHMQCMTEGGQPTCDKGLHCVCVNPDVLPDITVTISEELKDGSDDEDVEDISPSIMMYFLKLTSLFGDENKTENIQPISIEQEDTPDAAFVIEEESWTKQNLLTLLFVALLCVVVLLELNKCYSKKNRNKVDNLFQAMPTPNKS